MIHIKEHNGIIEIYKKQEGKKKVIAKGSIYSGILKNFSPSPEPPIYLGKIPLYAPIYIAAGYNAGTNYCIAYRQASNYAGHSFAEIYQVTESWWQGKQPGSTETREESIRRQLNNMEDIERRATHLSQDLTTWGWYDEASFNAILMGMTSAEGSVIDQFTPCIGNNYPPTYIHADDKYCYVYKQGNRYLYELKEE